MIRSISPGDLGGILRSFEDAWAERTGEVLTSAQFYGRYSVGDLDSMFAMTWASYYEAYGRSGRDEVAHGVAASLSDLTPR